MNLPVEIFYNWIYYKDFFFSFCCMRYSKQILTTNRLFDIAIEIIFGSVLKIYGLKNIKLIFF